MNSTQIENNTTKDGGKKGEQEAVERERKKELPTAEIFEELCL